jgi:hypothetical protein
MVYTGKNCEIHTMKFAIVPLDPSYIHTISIGLYYIHSMEISISMKIGFPYYFQPQSIYHLHSKDFEKKSSV